MMMLQWYWHTTVHKFWVASYIITFCVRLLWRALVHDLSKYCLSESHAYAHILPRLKGVTYGSSEYKNMLRELGPALTHHYNNNRHHPEFFAGGLNEMNLIDIVEMFLDWRVAIRKHSDGDIFHSIEVNQKRFKMSVQMSNILRNEARRGV